MKKFLLLSLIFTASLCQGVLAMDVYTIPEAPGTPAFKFEIYNGGEQLVDDDGNSATSSFTLSDNERDALFDAAANWKFIINNNYTYDADKLPTFAVITDKIFNASAGSSYVDVGDTYLVTQINAYINKKTPVEPDLPHGLITVGIGLLEDYPGWNHYTGSTALYQANKPDLYSTMVHEIYHAMGLISNAQKHVPGNTTYYFSKDTDSKIGIWDSGLSIYTAPVDKDHYDFDPGSITYAGKGMSIRIDKNGNETFDIVNYSPYFTGLNTLKVLTGSDGTKAQLQEIIYNKGGLINYSNYYEDNIDWLTKEPLVLGLPVNVIEHDKPELSHIELRNSFMSHQRYQNWAILMEAELAVLKDIGYSKVELRDFFGKSYYLNGIIDTFLTGYGKWDPSELEYTAGEYSDVENGVGLHIYGNNNVITQLNNQTLSEGKYAVGARIDGVQNTYILKNSTIDVKGDGSIGVAVAWGKNHTVNIQNGSLVKANGKDGIGVSFDFGKNVCGGMADDRGSYSFYSMDSKKNETPDIDIQDALIDTFIVNGSSIAGKKAAIYISENAHVKELNINNSTITGNIISKWNSVISGPNMNVMTEVSPAVWIPVNKDNPNEIYYTDLKFSGDTTLDGNIDGSNDIFNTLKVSNTGNLDFQGNEMNIYQLTNTGVIDFNSAKAPELILQSGLIEGNSGTLNFHNGISLADISSVKNIVNIDDGKFLSLADGTANKIDIKQLNSNNVDLYIDYGDSFILEQVSDPLKKTLVLKQISVDKSQADSLETTDSVTLFEPATLDPANTLDVTSQVNFYYNKQKHTFTQDTATEANKVYLKISHDTTKNYELSDAINDPTTGNYIVSVDEDITKNLGTVQGDYFEISGDEIDVAGKTGLIVDGDYNNKTVLKTDIYGASDSNITLLNEANMIVEANDDIQIGKKGETALSINNSTFEADLEGHNLTFGGEIKGSGTNTQNFVVVSAKGLNLDSVDNVALATKSEITNLNNTMTDTIWQIEGETTNILNDSYLSSNGTNSIEYNKGLLNILNNKASDINLKSMTLNADMDTKIDIDLGSMSADKFVFNNNSDLVTNGYSLNIRDLNVINQKTALTEENYLVPFISSGYKNTNFLGSVNAEDIEDIQDIMTPIFKYNLGYREDSVLNQGGFVFSRGATKDYNSYNPAIVTSSVAAQVGGYLNQLNSYDQAFHNMDMQMLMTREERQALKMANSYASTTEPKVFSPTYLPEKDAGGWFRPYTTFEKVGLKNGPRVENIAYGSFFGADSKIYETKNGWDYQYSLYAAYNGAHQNYVGNSIYQNGGTLGATAIWYKNNFFTALTANTGAGVAEASTMYGSEDMTMLMAGIASKTGYNWELARGKFIIQPSYLMSYSFVNTFDYTNAAGVRITSDPLNAINIVPGLRFIGNLKYGWQPYIGMQMVWNIMDDTKFRANDVALPDMNVRPYFQYGVGVQKRWGERFTGFLQAMIRNGGRDGIALSLGFRWALGK